MVVDPRDALRLRADLQLGRVEPGRVELAGEGHVVVVEGGAAPAIVPLLDGSRTLEQVVMELSAQLPLAEVVAAVGDLERRRYVVRGPVDGDRQTAAFWEPMGLGAAEAADRLSDTTVEVAAVGSVDVQPLIAALVEMGVQVVARDQASLVCVLAEDYLCDELGEINKAMLSTGTSWLLARPLGRELWLGPLLEPGTTGCWACLARALSAGDADAERPGLTLGKSAGAQRALAGLVATKVAEIMVGGTIEALRGRLVTLDSATLSSETHLLMRYPDCRACGVATPRSAQGPVVLQPTSKATREGGGHRARSLAETAARLERQVSRRLGVVRDLRPAVSSEEAVLYVWTAGLRFPVAGRARPVYGGRGWGKGRNDLQARVGALAEAHELLCGCRRGDEPVERGRLADRGEPAVPPEALLQFSAQQYDNRQLTNQTARGPNQVPERFDPETELEWSRVWSLTLERTRELPAPLCWFGSPVPGLGAANSNGCAAGSTVEEASLHGLGELIERDSVALWWYCRARRPGVDLDSFGDPYYDLLRERLAELGREMWVLDLSTDLGVPAFVAVSCLADAGRSAPVLGYGANLDAATAVSRAVTEHNQILAATTSPSLDPRLANPLAGVDAVSEPWLLPDPAVRHRRAGDYLSAATDDIAKDVAIYVARLAEAGIEVLVLDQSRPECELRVVRVTAPGLRHWWRRLAPGRLYDVPPAIGWIATLPTEEQLNPLDLV
jgi:ribosomal protein S12 methylthiotransferase accessory factor